LAHRALEGRLTTGIGLHAVNGALLLIVATFLAIGCADRKMSARARWTAELTRGWRRLFLSVLSFNLGHFPNPVLD
jgi:hypothetical protein